MTGEQTLVLVFSVAGFCITGLLAAVAYFMSRMVTQFEGALETQNEAISQIDKTHATSIGNTNKALHEAITSMNKAMNDNNLATNKVISDLTHSMDKLSVAIGTLEKESTNRNRDLVSRLTEHHEEIELCRARVHTLFNHVQAIRMLGELHNNWKFKSELEIPPLQSTMKREAPL